MIQQQSLGTNFEVRDPCAMFLHRDMHTKFLHLATGTYLTSYRHGFVNLCYWLISFVKKYEGISIIFQDGVKAALDNALGACASVPESILYYFASFH